MRIYSLIILFYAGISFAGESNPGYTYKRIYHLNETLSYSLTAQELDSSNVPKYTFIGKSNHQVQIQDGIELSESVKWIELIFSIGGATYDFSSTATAFPEYKMSLTNLLPLPELHTRGFMVGMVTDLYTFYNVLLFQDGARNLQYPGDRFAPIELMEAKIDNREVSAEVSDFRYYESCFEYAIDMLSLDENTVTYKIYTNPPTASCIENIGSSINESEVINFVLMLNNQNGPQLQWGTEVFELFILVETSTGVIQSAEFGNNYLRGFTRPCSTEEIASCDGPIEPLEVRRNVILRRSE